MNENILILSAGRRVELLEGFRSAVATTNIGSRIIATDIRPDLSAACQRADESVTMPEIGSPQYEGALLDLCHRRAVGLIVPTIDPELLPLAQLRDKLEKLGAHAIISSEEIVRTCRDKRKTSSLFKSIGIDTPKIYSKDEIVLPCFSKPFDGSSSVGAFSILDSLGLTEETLNDPTRMFMELIPECFSEITIDLYYDRHSNLRCMIPRERISTRSGEVSKGVTRRNWVYDYLLDRMRYVEGARGCLTLQVFASSRERRISAIEINPRFGGGYPLSLAAGADFPSWLINEYLLNRQIEFFDNWESDLLMLRYDAQVMVSGYGCRGS